MKRTLARNGEAENVITDIPCVSIHTGDPTRVWVVLEGDGAGLGELAVNQHESHEATWKPKLCLQE